MPTPRKLGSVKLEGPRVSIALPCDALAIEKLAGDDLLLLLSFAGSESAVKAVRGAAHNSHNLATPGKRSSHRKQQGMTTLRLTDVPDVHGYAVVFAPGGYWTYRAKLDEATQTWHGLLVAKRDDLIPNLSEESLWQQLRSDRFTTPLLRSWIPWLHGQLVAHRLLGRVEQFGCQVGLLQVTDEQLERLVIEGTKSGHLGME